MIDIVDIRMCVCACMLVTFDHLRACHVTEVGPKFTGNM
jgi:hypothetical protein